MKSGFSLVLLSTLFILATSTSEDFYTLVESSAASLTPAQLKDDQLVHLEVLQDHSIYKHTLTEKRGSPIFIRKGNDQGKSLVVLKSDEDFLPQCSSKKRTFIVLKQVEGGGNDYRVLIAYVRSDTVEWDSWSPRATLKNKAYNFGFTKCSQSSMLPCKKDIQTVLDDSPDYENGESDPVTPLHLPYKHPAPKVNANGGSDYWCDLLESSDVERRFVGSVIGGLTQSMLVLTGAELFYKGDEGSAVENVKEEIKAVISKGRAFSNLKPNAANLAAEKLVNMGRNTVAGGTLLFYAAVVKMGAFSVGEVPPNESKGKIDEAKYEELAKRYKGIGVNILKDLFRGIDFEDKLQTHVTPNPNTLLQEGVTNSLVNGLKVGEKRAQTANDPSGRGMFGWLVGKADVGTSSSNGEQVMRQYKGVQRDGSVTGSKGIDSLNFAIDNAFGGTKKSAGQVFAENIVAGAYMPLGIIEDAGDALSGGVLGVGKISDDRSYADDLVDKTMNVVGGAAGQIVDVVGDILGPVGLGGLWTGIAGVAATALGAIGGGFASPVLGIYELIKMGAKAVGIGGVVGMNGVENRQANEGQIQNANRYSAPQAGSPGMFQKRKREDSVVTNFDMKVEAITDVDLFSQLGWKTVLIRQEDLANATFNEQVPYIGFGNCIYKPTTIAELENVKNRKEASLNFFRSLRTDCLTDQLDSFYGALSEGYLKFNEKDKTFDIPSNFSILTKGKLSVSEINSLSISFEMSIYSKTYISSLKKEAPKHGSRSTSTFKSFALNYLQQASDKAPLHFIKLSRNIGRIAKSAFIKILQDFIRYRHCRKCNEGQMQDTLYDLLVYSSLIDFILKEQESPDYNGLSKESAFDKFFDTKRESVAQKMTHFFL